MYSFRKMVFFLILYSCHPAENNEKISGKSLVPGPELHKIISAIQTGSKPILPGLIDIQTLDSTILINLKYATTDNFTGKVLYKNLRNAYLQPDVANMLVDANRYLKQIRPNMRLLVYDAARPFCIQGEMYESVRNTPYHRYVANPDKTSLHNYAAAVDLTIADDSGKALDMGTPFDFFGKAAGINNEKELIRLGILTETQVNNRELLRKVMQQAGFQTIRGEWWHFNACSLNQAKKKYALIECLE